ncbi:hypothetical protein VNI00_016892 [Paramarasmius palmivorus]|uniref:Uncharacterized protein n=1 Tax=Paramarasmius palmivorus TaxID=297713 RepID=A0AAW0BAV7_9AGAR
MGEMDLPVESRILSHSRRDFDRFRRYGFAYLSRCKRSSRNYWDPTRTLIAQHAHELQDQDLPEVNDALLLSDYFPSRYDSAPLLPFLRRNGTQALVKMIATLVSKSKTIGACRQNYDRLHHIITTAQLGLMMLEGALQGPLWVVQALDADLISAMFKAQRLYGNHEVVGPHLRAIWENMTKVLERVALYAVYPSVVVRFAVTTKGIVDSDLEHDLESSQPDWEMWGPGKCSKKVYLKN